MKKTYRSFFCLLVVLLLSVSALPAASALFSERLYYYGTVEEISRAADGTVESVLVTAEGQETYEMVITERTQWQDHDEKTTSDPATLAVGEQICVVHDPAVMMMHQNKYQTLSLFQQFYLHQVASVWKYPAYLHHR